MINNSKTLKKVWWKIIVLEFLEFYLFNKSSFNSVKRLNFHYLKRQDSLVFVVLFDMR